MKGDTKMEKDEKLELLREAKTKFNDSVDSVVKIVGSYPDGVLNYDMDIDELIERVENLVPCEECGTEMPKEGLKDSIFGWVCEACTPEGGRK
jgi:hypothetical protein